MDAVLDVLTNPYYIQVMTMVGISLIAALGLHLITGITGQFSFGHAAFVSIGAYASALLTIHLHLPFILSMLAGGLAAALCGILLGYPSLRLTGDYLGITTLGFGEIVRVVFINMKITGGASGLTGIPRETNIFIVYVVVVLTIWGMYRIQNSRFGRALTAIREDEIAAETMGINTLLYKIKSFAIGTFFAGISGSLFAHMMQYLNPADFGFSRSFEILNFVVLGGLGSIPGTILGTVVLSLAPEFLRFVQEYRMLIYGALMVFMMIFRPNGLLGGVDVVRLLRSCLARLKVRRAS
ncbi:MAG TPA: branched-chain amino acid ABC transporter permease [Bacillota bacterium]|jgi:branched-chain amino acid transport system permease protein|nr:branched-chain amino acid ABC transporter permease [Peptococcaceae bacterium MAG4]NLW37728.1 branched-chain amino acid ABC transporter permease [Peptococcaceae bacterium]HPU35575.1 branched-chain amino acid ABC transporter permease [Bacillota bacterium]HPZ43207.1 branched-chain amino acid ABC transporter permease [Bacillota bacterium]HQD76047.1 branched-chain amino acid ABC transporter permease [Bacillota bacterium]